MLTTTGKTREAYGRGGQVEKSDCLLKKCGGSLPPEAQPHEIDGTTDAYYEAKQSEVALIEPLIEAISNCAPKEQARKEVAKNRPHCTLFTLCHQGLLKLSYPGGVNVGEVS